MAASIGVSPAYFLSAYGAGFTAADVCAALPHLAAQGFTAFQAEIFAAGSLVPWLEGGAEAVCRAAGDNGLAVSALVGHFALPAFADEKAFRATGRESGLDDIEALFRIATVLNGRQLVSLPLGPYAGGRSGPAQDAFKRKLAALAALGARYGVPVALEVQPGAFVSGLTEVAALLEEFDFGFNFDTGHTFASGHDPCGYPQVLGRRILATHLCDNDGRENLSLRPGRGDIDFPSLVGGLVAGGYAGSYDLEIFCPAGEVEREYTEGLRLLRQWLS